MGRIPHPVAALARLFGAAPAPALSPASGEGQLELYARLGLPLVTISTT